MCLRKGGILFTIVLESTDDTGGVTVINECVYIDCTFSSLKQRCFPNLFGNRIHSHTNTNQSLYTVVVSHLSLTPTLTQAYCDG